MRWPTTLSRCVAREVALYTLIGLAAISVVILSHNLVQVLEKLLGAGLRFGEFLKVLGLFGMMLIAYALPVSFLFGVLLAIGRMAADVEITAMRACGLGVRSLVLPIGLMGVVLSLLTIPFSLEIEPAAQRELSRTVRRMITRGATFESGTFNSIGDRTLYVDSREDGGRLRGVVISDRSDPERAFLVFAELGEMLLDEINTEWVLRLERGDVHVEPTAEEPDLYQHATFDQLEYRIDMTDVFGDQQMRPRKIPLAELREKVALIETGADPGPLRSSEEKYVSNLQRRYVAPFTPLLFALIGVPLGMQRKRGARSYGVIVCAVVAFGYYALLSFSELLVTESGFPALVIWLPNLGYAVLGLVLLVRARRQS